MTVRDLIYGSLRLIGAVATGETPDSQSQTDAFNVLSDMLDDWSNNSLLRYPVVVESITYVPGQQAYTMGTSGTPSLNTTRPIKIKELKTQIAGGQPQQEIPIDIITEREWADISVKLTGSSLPMKAWINDTYPNMTINLWPVPSVANTLIVYSDKPFASFSNLNSTLAFPPGWNKALRYNLAIELAPEYGVEPKSTVVAMAIESKAGIERQNSKPIVLTTDVPRSGSGGYNWITGE